MTPQPPRIVAAETRIRPPRARPETQLHGPCRQVQHERGHERDQQEHARQEAAEVFIFRCREQEDHAERRNRGDQIRAERQKPAREQTEHNHTEHRLTRGQRRQHHQKQQREVPAAVPQLHRPVGKAGKQALAACEPAGRSDLLSNENVSASYIHRVLSVHVAITAGAFARDGGLNLK